jgi:sn-glycerol 3-phosphate transport system permease protein
MNTPAVIDPFGRRSPVLETLAAWLLGFLWLLPLLYAVWTAFHPAEFATRFSLTAPLTMQNFVNAWQAAPFPRYFLNTFMLVTMILAAQMLLSTMAAYASPAIPSAAPT